MQENSAYLNICEKKWLKIMIKLKEYIFYFIQNIFFKFFV